MESWKLTHALCIANASWTAGSPWDWNSTERSPTGSKSPWDAETERRRRKIQPSTHSAAFSHIEVTARDRAARISQNEIGLDLPAHQKDCGAFSGVVALELTQ